MPASLSLAPAPDVAGLRPDELTSDGQAPTTKDGDARGTSPYRSPATARSSAAPPQATRRFHLIKVVALVLPALLAPPTARAESPADNEAIEAPPVVITGTRRETPLADTPIATEVISRSSLSKSRARNAAEALEMHQSLVVTSSFRGAGLEIQGLSARHVLILIDSERVTGKVGEQLDLSRFPAESIERIEIVKGSGSALYGSDAIGGVINIVTRSARPRPEFALDLVHGAYGRTEFSTHGAARLGKVGVSLGVAFRREDPFALETSTPATTSSGYEDFSTTLRITAPISKVFDLDARVQHLYREQVGLDATALPPDLDGAPRFRLVDRRELLHTLQLRLAPTLTLGAHRLAFSVSSSLAFSTLIEDQRAGTTYDRRQPTRETLVSPSVQWTAALGRHTLTAGTELNREHLESERLAGADPDRTRFALYAQAEVSLLPTSETDFAPSLTAIPGIRLDHDSQFGPALSPRLAVRFDPIPELTVRASYGLGFRAPGFRELHLLFSNPSVGYRIEGNPDLAPERSRSAELSVEARPIDGLTLALTTFRHDLDNLIITTQRAPVGGETDVFTYSNVALASSMGLELRVVAAPHRSVRIEAGYGFTDSRDDDTGLRILGRSTHQLTASLRWTLPLDLELYARAIVLGPRAFERVGDDGETSRFDSDWQPLVDLRLSGPIGDHLTLFVGLDNAFDTTDPTTLPHRPRSLFAGLSGRY